MSSSPIGGDEYATKLSAVNSMLGAIDTMYTEYTTIQSQQQAELARVAEIQAETTAQELELRELNRIESTLEQQYLDYKAAPPAAKGFFARFGLSLMQDWALAFFFAAYVGLALIVILVLAYESQGQKIRVVSFFGLLFLLVGFLISLLIRAFA